MRSLFRPLTVLCRYGNDEPTQWRAYHVRGYCETGSERGRVILPTHGTGYVPPEEWTPESEGWTLRQGDAVYPNIITPTAEATGNLRRAYPAIRHVSQVSSYADCGTMGNVEGVLS